MYLLYTRHGDSHAPGPAESLNAAAARPTTDTAPTNSTPRAQLNAIVSSTANGQVDPRTLAQQLQKAGVSPALIRAVVSAVIDVQFRDVFAARTYPPGMKYWELYNRRQHAARIAEAKAVEAQVSAAKEEAMKGIDVPEDAMARADRELRYGSMSAEKVGKVQQILATFGDLQMAAGSTRAVNAADRSRTLLAIQDERDEEIRTVLSPEEFRQYQLRQSQVATSLSSATAEMDLSQAEFEALYDIKAESLRRYVNGPTANAARLAVLQGEINAVDVVGGERGLVLAKDDDSFAAYLKAADAPKLGTDVVRAVLTARLSALQQAAALADQSFATPADQNAALDRIYAQAVSAVRTVAGGNTAALLAGKVERQLRSELQQFSRPTPPPTNRGKGG